MNRNLDRFITPVREEQHDKDYSKHDEQELSTGDFTQSIIMIQIIDYC